MAIDQDGGGGGPIRLPEYVHNERPFHFVNFSDWLSELAVRRYVYRMSFAAAGPSGGQEGENPNRTPGCHEKALQAYLGELEGINGSYSQAERAYIDDFIKAKGLFARADALEELGWAVGIGVVSWGAASHCTTIRGATTLATVAQAQAELQATVALANAGRIPASMINVNANLLAQAQRLHSFNTLTSGAIAGSAASGTLLWAAGRSDEIGMEVAGNVGDLSMTPSAAYGPGSLLVDAFQVAQPLINFMGERSAALAGQGVPGMEINNRLHGTRVEAARKKLEEAWNACGGSN